VIPVQKNKKPYVSWEKYQKEIAGHELIKKWWNDYPNANVAIVTGGISGLNVIDIDSQKGMEILDEMLPNSLITPIARTPRGGWHYYHQSQNGLSNATGFIEGVDFRGEGGYIIAPPSIGYSWLPDLNIKEVAPAPLPDLVIKALKSNNGKLQSGSIASMGFDKGVRDDTLYHTARSLFKGGMPVEEVNKVILSLAANCKPPFPPKESLIKVKSALQRLEKGDRNLTQEVRDWIDSTEGEFLTRDVYEELNLPKDQKGKISVILNRLISEKLIERTGRRTGCFRRIEKEAEIMNLFKAAPETVKIILPFGLHDLVKILPGNIIIIAGAVNAGKTGLLLNIIAANMNKFDIHYFNSEMGEDELTLRLQRFDDIAPKDWNFTPRKRDQNFHDVIIPGKGNINIIDYLELYEDFWIVGKRISEIYRKLNGAIAIIALQKNPGVDVPLGGYRGIEKARLALSLEGGTLKIIKAKNWKGSKNPNGREIKFKIVNGCKLIQVDDWSDLD